ncbi:MAG: thiamine-phosphate kinase [Desulfovibrionaceae bacterium]
MAKRPAPAPSQPGASGAGALLSENAFLACIDRHFARGGRGVLLGRGDDCAVLDQQNPVCVSTDLFLEDVHFRTAYFSAADAGHKALAVNVSDIAAMGAQPTGFTLGLMVRPGLDAAWWDAFFEGMAGLAARWHMPLVGGDVSRAAKAGACITVWGERRGALLTRGAARPGDVLFVVSGVALPGLRGLGLARTGLMALERTLAASPQAQDAHNGLSATVSAATEAYPSATLTHLRPNPLVEAGLALAEAADALDLADRLSLMDVSDGLASDVPRLIGADHGSGLGAALAIEPRGLHPELAAFCAAHGLDPVTHAVQGGEDYALLGAAPASAIDALATRVAPHGALSPIGAVTPAPGLLVNGASFHHSGFDHFSI